MSSNYKLTVGAVAALAAVTMTGCSRSPHLIVPGSESGGAAAAMLPDIKANTPMTFGMGVVCLDRAGRIKLDSATVHHPVGGLRVVDFAVRSNLDGHQVGVEPKPLRETAFGHSRVVDRVCNPKNGDSDALAVEVTKPTDAIAKGQGIVLHYTNNGKPETLLVPFGATLCPPGLSDYTKQCS